jgi:two-component system catabolic regulation response regulator CreB/two-component system response regulator ChvI
MPKMTGFELARALGKKEATLPICFLSANELYYDEFKQAFPTLQVSRYIKKPVQIQKLADIIKSEIRQRLPQKSQRMLEKIRDDGI